MRPWRGPILFAHPAAPNRIFPWAGRHSLRGHGRDAAATATWVQPQVSPWPLHRATRKLHGPAALPGRAQAFVLQFDLNNSTPASRAGSRSQTSCSSPATPSFYYLPGLFCIGEDLSLLLREERKSCTVWLWSQPCTLAIETSTCCLCLLLSEQKKLLSLLAFWRGTLQGS